MFEVGQECQDIYFVQSGFIDIVLTDGYKLNDTLDEVGKGSIIGPNMVLKREKWPFVGVVSQPMTCKVLCIGYSVIESLRREYKPIGEAITTLEEYL